MTDTSKERIEEIREKAQRLAIDVYNIGATHNAKNMRDPVAFRAAENYAFDAALEVNRDHITRLTEERDGLKAELGRLRAKIDAEDDDNAIWS